MTDQIERWRRLADCDALHGAPLGAALNEACDEIERLREHATGFAALHQSAESDVSAVIALVARWEQGVANLYAANGEEAVPEAAAIRSARAAQIECCIKELRDALSAPHSPAAARFGTSAATEASGGAGEAQEGRHG